MSTRFTFSLLSPLARASDAVIKALTAYVAAERRPVYNPARHYMRGPGPKWMARHGGAPATAPQPRVGRDS